MLSALPLQICLCLCLCRPSTLPLCRPLAQQDLRHASRSLFEVITAQPSPSSLPQPAPVFPSLSTLSGDCTGSSGTMEQLQPHNAILPPAYDVARMFRLLSVPSVCFSGMPCLFCLFCLFCHSAPNHSSLRPLLTATALPTATEPPGSRVSNRFSG